MRIPRRVAEELARQTGLGFIEQAVFFAACVFCPRSISELAIRAHLSRSTTIKACKALVALGWMRLARCANRVQPIAVIPHRCQELLAARLRAEYDLTPRKGEFLMKRFLDLRVYSQDFIENARPAFLENPGTSQLLEYDRYYDVEKVAFEFNGSQHFDTTEAFPDEQELDELKTRDAVKVILSNGEQVTLVVVTIELLLPRRLDRMLPMGLAKQPLDDKGPYYRTLNNLCVRYIRAVQQARKAKRD